MASEYEITVTSRRTATVEDVPLSSLEVTEQALTRKIARTELVNNVHNEFASVKLCIMHQRRRSLRRPWEDANSFDLRTLLAGQEVRLNLDSEETLKLLGLTQEPS
jgi:hypothetical protein